MSSRSKSQDSATHVARSGIVQSLLDEPRVPDAPTRVWRDWLLTGVVAAAAVLEAIFREDVVWRPVALFLALGVAVALLFRRSHPFAALSSVFGAFIVVDVAGLMTNSVSVGLYTTIAVIALPYALFRWGSGREAGIGLVILLVGLFLALVRDYSGIGEAVAAAGFLLVPAFIGADVRYWSRARRQELEQVKLLEREQLARELHDTVAHHVSAIVIQAQAGRAVAITQPAAAVEALEVIENAASQTLAEMRSMVGVLRQPGEPTLAPHPGVADVERLANSPGERPRVEVDLSGDLTDVAPSVAATIYRLAQESITNARRHAVRASRVNVTVSGEEDLVRLIVSDDGEASSTGRGSIGFGLIGMAERATLLGGTLEAGPRAGRGWAVTAVLPKTGRVA